MRSSSLARYNSATVTGYLLELRLVWFKNYHLKISLARIYRIDPARSPWVSEDAKRVVLVYR